MIFPTSRLTVCAPSFAARRSVSFTVASAELKQYKKHGEIIEALRSLDYVYYIEEMN